MTEPTRTYPTRVATAGPSSLDTGTVTSNLPGRLYGCSGCRSLDVVPSPKSQRNPVLRPKESLSNFTVRPGAPANSFDSNAADTGIGPPRSDVMRPRPPVS